MRVAEKRIADILNKLVTPKQKGRPLPKLLFTYTFILTNTLIAIWLTMKPLDEVFISSLKLIAGSNVNGYIAIAALDLVVNAGILLIFWNAVSASFTYFIGVHYYAIKSFRVNKAGARGEERLEP